MCTVTIIPARDADGAAGCRLVANRDESRRRPPALPPGIAPIGARQVVMPVDPTGGGTWIAANDAGLVMTLLNVTPAPRGGSAGPAVPAVVRLSTLDRPAQPALPAAAARSRGQIIPSLMHLGSVDAAVHAALRIDAAAYAAFRLIIANLHGSVELRSDARTIRCIGAALPGRAVMFTSSGLGDDLVEAPRRKLFEAMFEEGEHTAGRQDRFHEHAWLDRPHLSVRMSREDARTVSRTVVELSAHGVLMRYAALDDAGQPEEQESVIELPTAVAATVAAEAGAVDRHCHNVDCRVLV